MKNLFKVTLVMVMAATVFTASGQSRREARKQSKEAAKQENVVVEETVVIIEEEKPAAAPAAPGIPQLTDEQKNKALQMVIEEGNKLFDRMKLNEEQRGQFTSLAIKHLQEAQKVYMPDGKFVQQPDMLQDIMNRMTAFETDMKKFVSTEQYGEYEKYKSEKMQQAMKMMQERGGGGGGFGGFGGFGF